MAHYLHIRIDDHPLDARFLSVSDLSDYDPAMPVLNRTLIGQGPGFDLPVTLITQQGGVLHYSSKDFGYTTRKNKVNLPDGLYSFSYSVSPNSKIRMKWISLGHYPLTNRIRCFNERYTWLAD
jgi:hypothetical protein